MGAGRGEVTVGSRTGRDLQYILNDRRDEQEMDMAIPIEMFFLTCLVGRAS
jgi:hypothetical protein